MSFCVKTPVTPNMSGMTSIKSVTSGIWNRIWKWILEFGLYIQFIAFLLFLFFGRYEYIILRKFIISEHLILVAFSLLGERDSVCSHKAYILES